MVHFDCQWVVRHSHEEDGFAVVIEKCLVFAEL